MASTLPIRGSWPGLNGHSYRTDASCQCHVTLCKKASYFGFDFGYGGGWYWQPSCNLKFPEEQVASAVGR
jgi:hypothetical protein